MSIHFDIPNELEDRLKSTWGAEEFQRKILEAIIVSAYQEGILSRGDISELLSLDFWQTEAFLREREAFLEFDAEGIAKESEQIRQVLGAQK